jgi:hypothetical protein
MIRGLQMVISGKDLKTRIDERIRINEAAVAALDARLLERAGDAPFDVRLEDGLKTLEEVTADRDRLRDRVTQLTMMRDGIAEAQSYTLNRRDLRAADLISHDGRHRASDDSESWVDAAPRAPVQGLKLTFSGIELRTLLEARCEVHLQRAVHWRNERERTPEDATEDEPLFPDHMCENEAEECEWRADVLGFIRDHIDVDETYRLGQADLAFGDLLPEKPGWMQQSEYEERTGMAFSLGRIAKRFERLGPWDFCPQPGDAVRDGE